MAISGNIDLAKNFQKTWDGLWTKYGLEPMVYDYKKGTPNCPVYDLNPEIIESAYYLYSLTGDTIYLAMNKKYWENIKEFCRTDIAFTSVKNVETMEKKDYMPTFFFAETLKYFYLTFSHGHNQIDLTDYVFTTEAHPFKKSNFKKEKISERLGFKF
jgi:mannosidase alpha-like ER degradation enhancer 1/mannosidase alpha-like ER degradation enhancer 2